MKVKQRNKKEKKVAANFIKISVDLVNVKN